jgi:uncharacterized protein (DUF433 family)
VRAASLRAQLGQVLGALAPPRLEYGRGHDASEDLCPHHPGGRGVRGKACIDDTRVRVNNVAYLAKTGRTPDQILGFYPQLSLGQVHAALAYYYDHRDAIEKELADEEDMEQLVERSRA